MSEKNASLSLLQRILLNTGRRILPVKLRLKLQPLVFRLIPQLNDTPEYVDVYRQALREKHDPLYQQWLAKRVPLSSKTSCTAHIWTIGSSCLRHETLHPNDWVIIKSPTVKINDELFAALAEVNDSVKWAYTDHDFMDESGHRTRPQFKPELDPDWLAQHNYIGDLVCVRAAVFRPSDWKTIHVGLLALTSRYKRQQCQRIADVLWHQQDTTVAESVQQLDYEVPSPEPAVAIIIPAKNQAKLTRQCIQSVLEKTTYDNYQIVLVDNGSDQRAMKRLLAAWQKHPRITVLHDPRPFNYSQINNDAARQVDADILVLMNNDIEVISSNWLSEMVSHAARDDIGAVGAKLYFPDDSVQHAGVVIGYGGVAGHAHKFAPRGYEGYMNRLRVVHEVSAVTAACLAVTADKFWAVGGLDEEHLTVAFNDVDLCLKLRDRGLRNIWTPHAELYHHESVSRGLDNVSPQKKVRFAKEIEVMKERWRTERFNDPAYNPNLALDREDFAPRETHSG